MPAITREQINENIDENISNVTTEDGITPAIDGDNRKLILNYVDYQDSLKANTEDLGATAFSNNYNDLNNLPTIPSAKTSGAVTLNGIFQVLPYDINSCSFSGGKAFLPTTTENGKEIIVLATANNIEIRANESGTNRMFIKFQTYVASVTLSTNDCYRFTYVGFGGYWKAEILEGYTTENVSNKSTDVSEDAASDTKYPSVKAVKTYVDSKLPYSFWRAEVKYDSVVRVLHDGIGFTSPTITNPSNGVIRITKSGFFTGLDNNKLEFTSFNLSNFGQVYVTLFARSDVATDALDLNVYDMAGGQTGTPAGSCIVEFRIYN
jgi:hypothetical protein